jgi:hypothetical protein
MLSRVQHKKESDEGKGSVTGGVRVTVSSCVAASAVEIGGVSVGTGCAFDRRDHGNGGGLTLDSSAETCRNRLETADDNVWLLLRSVAYVQFHYGNQHAWNSTWGHRLAAGFPCT